MLYDILHLRTQMQWLAMVMCLYAGVASARTEEDQQTLSTNGVSSSLPEQCFYRSQTDCPHMDESSNKCPCKRITLPNMPEGNAVLCCNIESKQALDNAFSCIRKHYTVRTSVKVADCSMNFHCKSLLSLSLHSRTLTTIKHKLYTYT